ncbi:2'-5' RNA ligase [Collinsella sp. CAG:398]|nr:2'-5' RNA ligase [Collinsella sp. CAG:398]
MRAFVALELPETFAGEVSALARQLRPAVAGRFMRPETYHLTLAFLGEIGEPEAARAVDALDEVCERCGAVRLSADGLGTFGRPHDATLWLGIALTEELRALAKAVRSGLEERGIAYDRKAFRPHITLARRSRLPQGDLPELVFPDPERAYRVALFKSELSQEGASYKELYHIDLG